MFEGFTEASFGWPPFCSFYQLAFCQLPGTAGTMAEEEKGTSAWYRVPTWDGSPATWRAFKKEMGWWTSSLNLEDTKKYNLAARWLLRQTGAVRARGEEFEPSELEYKKAEIYRDPQSGEMVEVSPADPLAGLTKLMVALEALNGKTALDRKGELRSAFYLDLRRKPGERLSEFCTRFRVLVSEMRQEGIQLPAGELGWFLKSKLGLDAIRTQLLETALGGKDDYNDVETEVLRLFKDLHAADPLQRRAQEPQGPSRPPLLQRFLAQSGTSSTTSRTSYPSSMASNASARSFKSGSSIGGRPPFRKFAPRQANVAEMDEEHAEEEAEPDEEDSPERSAPNLEEVLQAEAEGLAAELEMAELDGVDTELINELEAGVENAAETLITMREARGRLAEVRRDRGYGRPPTSTPSSTSPGKGKPHGNQVTARKQSGKHPCWDCNEHGHWAGDPQCPKPGAGLGKKRAAPPKQVKMAEMFNTEHFVEPVREANVVQHDPPAEHEVLMAGNGRGLELDVALRESRLPRSSLPDGAPSLSEDKRLVGALDSACNRTCCGTTWLNGYLKELKHAPMEIQALVIQEPEDEMFRFGNGGSKRSQERWRLPAMIGGDVILFWTSVVQVPSLGLLLGRDFMDALGAVLSFAKRALRCDHLDSSVILLLVLVEVSHTQARGM